MSNFFAAGSTGGLVWQRLARAGRSELGSGGAFCSLLGGDPMSQLDPIPYSDAQLRAILERVRTIAMVGASSNWNRPSYFVMKYLQGKGYRVIPVNPGLAGQELLDETVYASLRDIPEPV